MSETRGASVEKLQPAQAIDLCQLVELEACWENLRKAYWWADRISLRLNEPRVSRSTSPGTMEVAIRDFEALSCLCDALASVAVPCSQAVPPPLVPTQPS